MKKFIIALLFCFLTSHCYADTFTVDSLVSPDDITMAWLNGFKNTVIDALNSFPGENIQAATITTDSLDNNANPELRWGEAFNEFVYTGLLPAIGTRAAAVITAGTAYIREDSSLKMKRVVKDAIVPGIVNYPASKDIYVDLSSNGTYAYNAVANGAAEPSTTTNSIRLAKVVTDATDVTTVTDMRITGVQISTNEDYALKGMELYWGNPDIISVDAGVLYNGATRIKKSSATVLNVGTASNYINGASERAVSTILYVYCDDNGSIKLDDNAPDYADTEGNTVGTLRYFKNGTDYWRRIGAVLLNSGGAGYVEQFEQKGNKIFFNNIYNNTEVRVLNAGNSAYATWADVDCSGIIPVGATTVSFNAVSSGALALYWRPKGSSATSGTYESFPAGGLYTILPDKPLHRTSRIGQYAVSANTITLYVKDYTWDER